MALGAVEVYVTVSPTSASVPGEPEACACCEAVIQMDHHGAALTFRVRLDDPRSVLGEFFQ